MKTTLTLPFSLVLVPAWYLLCTIGAFMPTTRRRRLLVVVVVVVRASDDVVRAADDVVVVVIRLGRVVMGVAPRRGCRRAAGPFLFIVNVGGEGVGLGGVRLQTP